MDKKMTAQEIAQNMTAGPLSYESEMPSWRKPVILFSLKGDIGHLGTNNTARAEDMANAQAIVTAVNATYGAGIDPDKIGALVVAAKNAIECRPEHIEGQRRSALDYLAGALSSLYIPKQDTEK